MTNFTINGRTYSGNSIRVLGNEVWVDDRKVSPQPEPENGILRIDFHGMDADLRLQNELAALCHSQWAGWMQYLFSKCTQQSEEMIIPGWAVQRWQRQMATPYHLLSDSEKESDRIEANKFLSVIRKGSTNEP